MKRVATQLLSAKLNTNQIQSTTSIAVWHLSDTGSRDIIEIEIKNKVHLSLEKKSRFFKLTSTSEPLRTKMRAYFWGSG